MISVATFVLLVSFGSSQGWWLVGPKQKCYDIYGTSECFSTESPYDNTNNKPPESPGDQQVRFALYTPNNPTIAQFFCGIDQSCITSSNFDGSKKTRVIVHGYSDNFEKPWIPTTTAELIKYDGSNVIVVDWEKGADNNFLNYLQSAANTRVVGALLATLIKKIITTDAAANYGSFHLIGHSLGAHVCGEAGRRMNGQIGRITGLDPAGPGFSSYDKHVRLDKTDAQYVDAIHTDGDNLSQGGFGTMTEMGDADFYPNGGKDQPGCAGQLSQHLLALFLSGIGGMGQSVACNHLRVLPLFTESINSACQFTAYSCSSLSAITAGTCPNSGPTAIMGFLSASSASGKYYLTTKAQSPYC